MTQPNQSELEDLLHELGIYECTFKLDTHTSDSVCYYCGGQEWKPQHTARATLNAYITANYTANSEVMKLRLESAAKLANLDQKIQTMYTQEEVEAIIEKIIGIDEIALSPNGMHIKEGKLARNKLRKRQRERLDAWLEKENV